MLFSDVCNAPTLECLDGFKIKVIYCGNLHYAIPPSVADCAKFFVLSSIIVSLIFLASSCVYEIFLHDVGVFLQRDLFRLRRRGTVWINAAQTRGVALFPAFPKLILNCMTEIVLPCSLPLFITGVSLYSLSIVILLYVPFQQVLTGLISSLGAPSSSVAALPSMC